MVKLVQQGSANRQTDTHKFRHSVMQYNSGLLNISSDTFSHHSVAGTEKDYQQNPDSI